MAKIKSLQMEIENLQKEIMLIAGTVDKKNVPVKLVDWFYWESPYAIEDLSKATGASVPKLRKLISPRKVEVKCKTCKTVLIKSGKSKAAIDGFLKDKHECADCIRKKAEKKKTTEIKRKEKAPDVAAKRRVTRWGAGLDLVNMPYNDYLKTEYWKKFAHYAREKANFTCQNCMATGVVLHVHHLTYDRRGCERYEDVRVLCKPCHEKVHGRKL